MRISDWSSDVCSSDRQAPFEFVDRRRQDENANRLRPFAFDLARALPIDVEDDIVAGVEQRARFGKPGAIATTEHFGMFEEISARNLLGETGLVDEVIEIGRASCRERVCQYV